MQQNTVLVNMHKILLKRCFSNSQKAGVNTRPLIKQLSTLLGHVSEALGSLAMLKSTLSRQPGQLTVMAVNLHCQMLSENLREMESILTELLECSVE